MKKIVKNKYTKNLFAKMYSGPACHTVKIERIVRCQLTTWKRQNSWSNKVPESDTHSQEKLKLQSRTVSLAILF